MTNLAQAYVPEMAEAHEDRLKSQLVRLGASIPRANSGLRRLSAPDARGLLANLLREVDETILPRRMDVETGGQVVAHLHVAARRLVHLTLPGPQISGVGGLKAPDQIAMMFANQLLTVLTGATELTLRLSRLAPDPNAANTGCSARRLAGAASLEIGPTNHQDAARDFFAALGRYSIAWLTLDPDGVPIAGDGSEIQIARLSEMAQQDLDDLDWQLERTIPHPGAPGCLLLNYSDDVGFCLLYGRSDVGGFMAVLPAQAVPKIQPLWRQYFG